MKLNPSIPSSKVPAAAAIFNSKQTDNRDNNGDG
jgi:hypothetical protein